MKTMYNAIVDKKLLKKIIEGVDKFGDVNAMCIWGAFADEVPGIHLGHLHMINKLWDLAERGIRVSICINEEPASDPDNSYLQNLVKRHANTTASMLRVLSGLANDGAKDIPVYVGRDETNRLRQDNPTEFDQVQQVLEKARYEIETEFLPLRDEGPTISDEIIGKLQPKICKRLEIEESAFNELVELFVVRNKAHASTLWASDFGATMHLMKDRPSFLLVGQRHGYIWALYDCMFRHAGLPPIPVVRLENFMDCVGAEPMNSRNPENCIRLDEAMDIMKRKFLKGARLAETNKVFALRDAFEKLIFARGGIIVINKFKCTNYQDVLNAGNELIDSIVDAAVEFLRRRYWSAIPVLSSLLLVTEFPHTDELVVDNRRALVVDNRRVLVMNNLRVLNHIAKGLPVADNVINLDESVNREPQSHMDIYNQVLDQVILGTILDPYSINPQMMNNQYLNAAFEGIKTLIHSTRDMDFLPYQISKRHRDHYYHQINVGGLGAMLLDVHISNEMPLWKYMAQTLKLEGNDEVKERKTKAIWWIAALLHDHAYELEYAIPYIPNLIAQQCHARLPHSIRVIFSEYQQMLKSMMADDLETKVFSDLFNGKKGKACRELDQLVGGWVGRIKRLVPAGLKADDITRMAHNHGVIGAINFLCKIAVDDLDDEWKNFFVSAAAAILVHHLPNMPEVSFVENPLSFLLILVDEIQEWSRLLLHEGEYKSCLDRIELRPFISYPEQPRAWQFDDHLEVVFPFSDEDILRNTEWDRERFHKDKAEGLGRLVLPNAALNIGFPHEIKWREEYVSEARQV